MSDASECICADLNPPYTGRHHDTRCPCYQREHDHIGPLSPLAEVCITLDMQQRRVVATFRRVHLDDGQASTLLLCLCSVRGLAAIGLDEGATAKCYRCKRIYRVPAVPESDAGLSDPVWVEPIDDGDGLPFEGPHWSTPRIGR